MQHAVSEERQAKGVAVVAVNSNDTTAYPEDSPAKMTEEANAHGYTFPYLFDETQEVAKAYRAACTPDFFLFDKGRKLVYRGQLDDSRPSNDIPVTGADIRRALDACDWKVSGENGAARLLGIPASTLSSRIKALKIQR